MKSCCYCGKRIMYPLKHTQEHLIPRSKGGNNRLDNKRDCCNKCNSWRSNQSLDQWEGELTRMINKKQNKPPFYSVYDLKIMIENIQYLRHYIETAGTKLYKINNNKP